MSPHSPDQDRPPPSPEDALTRDAPDNAPSTPAPAANGKSAADPDVTRREHLTTPLEVTEIGGSGPDAASPGDPYATRPDQELSTTGEDFAFKPHRVGDYVLLEEIARGGMGVVYKARQVSLQRVVALKMILAGRFASTASFERFRGEARAAAALNHPGIVPVFEIGEMEGQPFFTMPFVVGGSLHAMQQRVQGPLPPLAAARLILRIAEAVQCAHDSKIIHRDIKPQNILLHRDGTSLPSAVGLPAEPPMPVSTDEWSALTPMLTDFGLARGAIEGSGLTRTGEVMGTPSYMPPEQAEGNLKAIGPQSDIYSLGAVLYSMLTGRPPFQSAEAFETIRQVREEDVVPPRQRNPRVPRDLESICLKCLAKDPRQRYVSASQLTEDLRLVLADRPPQYARAVRPLDRLRRRLSRLLRRHPLVIGNVILSAIAITLLAIVLFSNNSYNRELAETRELETQAENFLREGKRYEAQEAYTGAALKYDELIKKFPKHRELGIRRAHVHIQKGILLGQLREWQGADVEFGKAQTELSELEKALSPGADADHCQLELAELYHNLGILEDSQGTDETRLKALGHYGQARRIRDDLHRREPDNRSFQRDLARSYGYLGDTQLPLGLFAEARGSYDESERLRADLVNRDPADTEAQCQLARSKGNTGFYHDWANETEEALAAYRERLRYTETIPADQLPPAFLTDRASCLLSIAELLLDRSAPADEEPLHLLEKARDKYNELAENAARSGKRDRSLEASQVQVYVNLGKYHLRRQQYEDASRNLDAAVAIDQRLAREAPRLAEDYYRLAEAKALLSQLPTDTNHAGNELSALNGLKAARELGYRNVARVKRDVSFQALSPQNRQTFQQIVADMEKVRRESARLARRAEVTRP